MKKYLIISVSMLILLSVLGFLFVSTLSDNGKETANEHVTECIDYTEINEEYSEIPQISEPVSIKITFAGDVLLASLKNQTTPGSFNEYANNNSPAYFLRNVRDIFKNDDLTIVNLENVLTDNNLQEIQKEHAIAYWFKSKTSNTDILTCSGVEAVSLANNHMGDYGIQGEKDTVSAVEKAGLLYGNNSKTFYYEKTGFRIAVICHGLWSEWQANDIIKRIKQAEENSDFQIVYYHGGAEGTHTPEDWKIRASRKLADNGADLVIGSHPHVLQPMETYNGVDIVYSMGNFCFGGNRHPENRTIIYQTNLVLEDGILVDKTSEIIPCYVYTGESNNYCPDIIGDEETKQKVMDFMNWKLNSPV